MSLEKSLLKLNKLVEEEYEYNDFIKSVDTKKYFWYLIDEVNEAHKEIKDNNKVYLENELWDIIYVYLHNLEKLQRDGRIDKINVLERAFKKFSEKLKPCEEAQEFSYWKENKHWEAIKLKQKQEMKEEHEKLYGKK